MNDPIVDEVRRVRDAHAAKFNYDLDAIYLDIKEQESRSGRTFVSFTNEVQLPASSEAPNPSLHQTPRKAVPLVS